MKVGIVGVGKLGQPCAEVMAEHYDVIGYDLAKRTPENFPMVNSIKEVVKDRDLIFIAIQTPHDPMYGGEKPTSHLKNKDFDYSYVVELLHELNKYVNKNQLVILISTTLPGTVRNQMVPYISNTRFIYNPYLIAMGTVKWDMVHPEMVIIGTEDGSTTGDAKILMDFYDVLMDGPQRYVVGTWDEAECIKIFYNTFISAKLSLVNMIQDVAVKSGNINTDVVTKALADSSYRITGPAYMKAGMGDGGPCHPRDNIALRHLAEKLDLGYNLFDTIMYSREIQARHIAEELIKHKLPVCILGKSYKPNVDFTDGSPSLLVGYYAEELGASVFYDTELTKNIPVVYLLGHYNRHHDFPFNYNSVIVDPWRKFVTDRKDLKVVHYGNTRL